jgi:hypothetical protein
MVSEVTWFNPFDVKENDEYALHLSHFFFSGLREFGLHAFFTEWFSNHYQGLCCTFSEICAKFDAVSLLDPMRNNIRQIHNSKQEDTKNQHIHPDPWNFVH